jgi:hypothetical protein
VPDIPAICPNGHQFPSGISMGVGASGLQIVGGRSSCPVCGKMGVIPDGSYSAPTESIIALRSLGNERLNAVVQVLRRSKTATADEIVSRIQQEVPEAADAVETLVKWGLGARSGTLAAWVAVIIMLLTVKSQTSTQNTVNNTVNNTVIVEASPPLSEDDLKNLIERKIAEAMEGRPPVRPTSNTSRIEPLSPTPGRNDPCHCGSGRRFKHCHGG